MKPTLLVIDDDQPISQTYIDFFSGLRGLEVVAAGSLAEASQLLLTCSFDCVLLDVFLPDGNGVDFLPELRAACPNAVIVLVTGMGDIPLAVDAMSRGADNFLTKPVNMEVLDMFLTKHIETVYLRKREQARNLTVSRHSTIAKYESPAMVACNNDALLAARHESPVLILGETGTGKSVLAHWVHDNSQRARGPFVEVNCSSLKGELLGSELFGHTRGAFTGAVKDRQGLIEYADGGTLFLDEIGDMALEVQAELLNVIENKIYRRIGEPKTRRSDFRLISATNRNVLEDVNLGRFRRDLYYRISMISITLPPLRQRTEDMSFLINDLLTEFGVEPKALPVETIEYICKYSWPGNIRELRNILERAFMFNRDMSHLKVLIAQLIKDQKDSMVSRQNNPAADNKEITKQGIIEAIDITGGNRNDTAFKLGISRATLYRKMKEFGLI